MHWQVRRFSCKPNIYMSWSTSEWRLRLAHRKTSLSPPVIYFTDRSKAVLLLCIFYGFFSVLCLLWLRACLFICALWSPAGKGQTSWLSFVVSNCMFVTFPLVSWVRCGTWLSPLLTLNTPVSFIYSKKRHWYSSILWMFQYFIYNVWKCKCICSKYQCRYIVICWH